MIVPNAPVQTGKFFLKNSRLDVFLFSKCTVALLSHSNAFTLATFRTHTMQTGRPNKRKALLLQLRKATNVKDVTIIWTGEQPFEKQSCWSWSQTRSENHILAMQRNRAWIQQLTRIQLSHCGRVVIVWAPHSRCIQGAYFNVTEQTFNQ